MEHELEMGAKYESKITGFKGVLTGVCYYFTGCTQGHISPKCGKDGVFIEGIWFDIQTLKKVPGKTIEIDNSETPGADFKAPSM